MIIKKIRAEKVEDAEKTIKEELGPEAIILTTRVIKEKGIKALFSTENVEVTAAVDEEDLRIHEKKRKAEGKGRSRNNQSLKTESQEKHSLGKLDDSLADIKRVLERISKDTEDETLSSSSHDVQDLERTKEIKNFSETYSDPRYMKGKKKEKTFENEKSSFGKEDKISLSREARLTRRKKDLELEKTPSFSRKEVGSSIEKSFSKDMDSVVRSPSIKKTLENKEENKLRDIIRQEFTKAQESVSLGSLTDIDKNLLGSARFLVSKGISRSIAVEIEKELISKFGEIDLKQPSQKRTLHLNGLKDLLAKKVEIAGPICLKGEGPTIVALVGPSGVGKTTTLMKIAFQYIRELNKKVAAISLDMEKHGGMEQIRGMAKPLNMQVAVAKDGRQLQKAVAQFSEQDLILIDTSGRSQYSWKEIDDLVEVLSYLDNLQILLTMSITTKDLDTYGIIQQFSVLDVDSFVFTKLDETIALGLLINVCDRIKKPIRYLTMGKSIEKDLLIANDVDIARKILIQKNSQEFQHIRKLASV